MGFAHGTLLKEEATDLLNSVWKYMEDQVVSTVRVLDKKISYVVLVSSVG